MCRQNAATVSALRCWALTLLASLTASWPRLALCAANDTVVPHCLRFHPYEAGIAEDLLPWQDDEGISEALMDHMLSERSLGGRNRHPGLPLAVVGGKLFVVGGAAQSIANCWAWQADNIVVYAHALRRLVGRWGSALPDVEFLVETQDAPAQDLGEEQPGGADGQLRGGSGEWGVWSDSRHGRLPVMRHCKTASSLDIAIPTFHFYTLHLDEHLLSAADRINREHPWEARLPAAFAAGANYHRHQAIPATTRAWDGKNRGKKVDNVRANLADYLAQELRHPNISYSHGSVAMEDWARYRMVMHVDGITCSSRLVQLLALGSVVLREQSGYLAFHDKLLTRFIHFVPFWSHRPREVVWAFNWVMANEEEARAVAVRGQAFARQFLNREAIECFWLLLLRRYSHLLRFSPGRRAGGAAPELMPIDEWLRQMEGRVKDWRPTQVADRERDLDLLPLVDMAAGRR